MMHRRIPFVVILIGLSFALCALARAQTTPAPGAVPPASPAPATANAPQSLRDNDFVAICGDSITEQKLYSVYMEDYLLMCKPRLNVRAMQFGWGGEVVGGFLGRMSNVLRFPVTVATTCYGMNDGGYVALTPERAKTYRDGTKAIVETFKKSGVRFIVVGSPGAVGTKNFHVFNTPPAVYNKTLADLSDIARQVAAEEHVGFADLHSLMIDVMAKAKAKYGADYPFAGKDGVHPEPCGHLVMAYAFLKALGCDGDIGTITVDLAAGNATATQGHKILSDKDGTVEIESTRYPFCLFGDPKDPGATSGIVEFFPFNQDLNRFMLVVKPAPPAGGSPAAQKYKVTWGAASREYSAAELAKGVNLAADFLVNPFSEPFKKVQDAIQAQQNFETPLIKQILHDLPEYANLLPEQKDLIEKLAAGAIAKAKQYNDAAAAAVQPVKHTIRIEPVH